MNKFLITDIDQIVKNTGSFLKYFNGKSILITGGNGFLGNYFVETFKSFNNFLKNPIKLFIVDRTSVVKPTKDTNFTFLWQISKTNLSFKLCFFKL